jgi:hypothetical protein
MNDMHQLEAILAAESHFIEGCVQAAKRTQTLLEELAEIDAALTEGEATPEQEKRGQEIVTLADAAQELLETLQLAQRIIEGLEMESVDNDEKIRAAIAKATGGAA